MYETVRNLSPEVEEAIEFLSYLMLENLSDVILKNVPYNFRDKWPVLGKFGCHKAHLPLMFSTFLELVPNNLNSTRPRQAQCR